MRRFFNLKFQLLLMSLFLVCACSKDNDGTDNTPSIEVGVHKIELSLDGDWKNFNCEFGFVGVRKGSTIANITGNDGGKDNGGVYNVTYKGSKVEAWTNDGCIDFTCSIFIYNLNGKEGKVTVNATGYVDGKKAASGSTVIEVNKDNLTKSCVFNSVNGLTTI